MLDLETILIFVYLSYIQPYDQIKVFFICSLSDYLDIQLYQQREFFSAFLFQYFSNLFFLSSCILKTSGKMQNNTRGCRPFNMVLDFSEIVAESLKRALVESMCHIDFKINVSFNRILYGMFLRSN